MDNEHIKPDQSKMLIEDFGLTICPKVSDLGQPVSRDETTSSEFVIVKMGLEKEHKTVIFQPTQFCRKTQIQDLKEDMAKLYQAPGKQQQWFYKSSQLNNNDTLNGRGVKNNDYITVRLVYD